MTNNVFDQLSGIHDGPDGLGFLKKLVKGIKKVTSVVTKAHSKVAHKILPKKIRAIGKKMDKSGLNKVAAGIALAWVGGPAIMAGLAKFGGAVKGSGLLAKGASLVKSGASLAKSASAVSAVVSQAKGGGDANAAQAETMRQAQISADLARAAGSNAAFQTAVMDLKAQGYDDEAILNHWVESRTYYEQAVEAATKAVYPQAVQQYQAAGYPPDMAVAYGAQEAFDIAQTEVKKVQGQTSGGNLVIPAGIILALLMGG